MKDYAINSNGNAVTFSVDEDWLQSLKVNVSGDIEQQIYNAALADPEISRITTDDDTLNKCIEDVKSIVAKVKEINKAHSSDIRVLVESKGTYAVKFAGQVYGSNYRLRDLENAVNKIKAYLDHDNMIKVRIFEASDKTPIQRAMDLEAFIANRVHRLISVADNGTAYTVVFIEKGFRKEVESWDDED